MIDITKNKLDNEEKLVNFPLNKESSTRLDDPLKQLQNEFADAKDDEEEVQSIGLSTCENIQNPNKRQGQLELFNLIQDQIHSLSEHQNHICYLMDEIDMYLPRKR